MENGEIIYLECMGTIAGPRWLEGNPAASQVRLTAERTAGEKSGAWRVTKLKDGVILLESLASAAGNHWLDGVTAAGRVHLAPFSDATGLRWRLRADSPVEPKVFFIECLGHLPGNKWLDGLTAKGEVRLAPSTDGLSGTRWKIYRAVDFIDFDRQAEESPVPASE